MILIRGLRVQNYRNLREAVLERFGALNVFVGPNNCGKTSLLNALGVLSQLSVGTGYGFSCERCRQAREQEKIPVEAAGISITDRDQYLGHERVRLSFSFDEVTVNKLVPGVIDKQRENIQPHSHADHEQLSLVQSTASPILNSDHWSIFAHSVIAEEIKRTVLFCPEGRLQNYRGKNIQEYIREKNLRGAQLKQILEIIRKLVDPKLSDYTYDLRLELDDGFLASFDEQGSGVRSMVCLIVDIVAQEHAKILLIDEPELGLNPYSKHELLKLLLEQTAGKQIFMATHDPTFVNPTLWKNQSVSVFLYSLSRGGFVKVNLEESKEDSEVFAGYLPHTVSLRNLHLYVEGSSDVYIFQVFLQKYLQGKYANWPELMNRIGIYHLGGDFWEHLTSTLPGPPYKCLMVLDGEEIKRQKAAEICQKHDASRVPCPKLKYCRAADDVKETLRQGDGHAVYCLSAHCVEEYLEPKPDYKSAAYNKKVDGPQIASEMEKLPEEIEQLFETVVSEML